MNLFRRNTRYAIFIWLVIMALSSSSEASSLSTHVDTLKQPLWQSAVLPLALISGGIILNDQDRKLRIQDRIRNRFGVVSTPMDDYLQHVPILTLAIYELAHPHRRDRYLADARYLMMSGALSVGLVHIVKTAIPSQRPSGGKRSFPSGHTTYAFTMATVQFQLLRKENIWLALSGYLPAAGTAFYRVVRDKHWVSDVLVGAGIGILIPNVLSRWKWLHPLKVENARMSYQFGIFPSGFAILCTF